MQQQLNDVAKAIEDARDILAKHQVDMELYMSELAHLLERLNELSSLCLKFNEMPNLEGSEAHQLLKRYGYE
jgi:hypothetical protein